MTVATCSPHSQVAGSDFAKPPRAGCCDAIQLYQIWHASVVLDQRHRNPVPSVAGRPATLAGHAAASDATAQPDTQYGATMTAAAWLRRVGTGVSH